MNQLSQYLVDQILLEEEAPKITALYGGGFKPPTKGHFEVAQKILEEYPEIDELKILVGPKKRGGVTQSDSILIWETYKKHLPFKVSIEPITKPPIGFIYSYSKENPNESVYWILGEREGLIDKHDFSVFKPVDF